MSAQRIEVLDRAEISTGIFAGGGTGGSINIRAGVVEVAGDGIINAAAEFPSGGTPGNIDLRVDELILLDSGLIRGNTFGFGGGGSINVTANHVRIQGSGSRSSETGIVAETGAAARGAGEVVVTSKTLDIVDGGRISSRTFGMTRGGDIQVHADSVSVSGKDTTNGIASQIASDSTIFEPVPSLSGGDGGTVSVDARILTVRDGGLITAGSITAGRAGDLVIGVDRLQLAGGKLSVETTASGDAGDLRITAAEAVRLEDGQITATAPRANGGNIEVQAQQRVDLVDSAISANVGDGVGGNITIDPVFVIVDSSQIVARAGRGQGGNIDITADVLLVSPDSQIDASAGPAGISGTVEINSPTVDVAGSLATLPESVLDASSLMRDTCTARAADQGGSFAVTGRDGAPPRPDGWLGANTSISRRTGIGGS